MRLFRICRAAYAAEAWSGEGAWRHGGRWNPRHTRVIYTSTSLALAAMEYFVNLEPGLAPDDLLACPGELPEECALEEVTVAQLPAGWNQSRSAALRAIGHAWLAVGGSVALRVPSAAVPGEWNVLLNPAHADFARFQPLGSAPFRFDPRMFKG